MPQTRSESSKARRGGGPKALADSLRKVTRQALGQRSLAEQSLILDWSSIAGGDIAGLCTPQGLAFQHRARRVDGTLTLKVQSGHATRLQHLEPQLIERINGYFGYRAIARLRLLHGAPPASGAPRTTGPPPEAPREDPAPLQAETGDAIGDPALSAALARLGRAVKTSGGSGE